MQPEILNAAVQSVTPFMQYGFAGFAFIQFLAFVWVCYKAITVIGENTMVIRQLNERDIESTRMIADIRDRLLSRPCIAREE